MGQGISKAILKVDKIRKSYHKRPVLNDLSLTITRPGIYAFIGDNHAGKTSFFRAIGGLAKPNEGDVIQFGDRGDEGLRDSRKLIGGLIDGPAINGEMSAYDNMNMQRILYGVPGKENINYFLKKLGLNPHDERKVKYYSSGCKKRLAIAMALLPRTKVLILDEPFTNLDTVVRERLDRILLSAYRENRTTILMSGHILSEFDTLATDFVFMENGRIKATYTREEMEDMREKYLLLEPEDLAKGTEVIKKELGTGNYTITDDFKIHLYEYLTECKMVAEVFSKNNVLLNQMVLVKEPMEEVLGRLEGGDAHA